MKRLIAILSLLWLISLPGAMAIGQHEVEYNVEGENVLVREQLSIDNRSEVNLFVPQDAYDIKTWVDGEPGVFRLGEQDGYRVITVDTEEHTQEVKVEYGTTVPVDRGRTSYFVYGFKASEQTELLKISLMLPEGAVLSRPLDSPTPPVNPFTEEVTTTGRRMIIRWEEEEVPGSEVFSMFVSYEEDRFNWLYLTPLLVLAIFLALFFYYRKKRVEETLDSFSHLLDKEKKIVRALAKADDNTMWQKKLQYKTGFTKSKLSRTLRNLEERNVVEKMPYGTSNKVRLILEDVDESEDEEN